MNKIKYIPIITFMLVTLTNITIGQERKIKVGDAITIAIYNNEQLTQTVTVKPGGTVDYPALQGLPIDGITLNRLQEILAAQLTRFMEQPPLVGLKFAENYPINITILGQVNNPGMYTIFNTSSIQGAIIAAGGFISGAQLTKIKIIRTDINGKTTTNIFNMEKFYLTGDPTYLPNLLDGDTIVIPGNPLATTVKVLGQVQNPGSYNVSFQTSLLDVLYMAGGPTNFANLNKVQVYSLSTQDLQNIRLDMKELMKNKNINTIPMIMPGDVVYIPEKVITWNRFISIFRDLTTFATLYYLIYRSTSN